MIDSNMTKVAIACTMKSPASICNSFASILLLSKNGACGREGRIFRNGPDVGAVNFPKASPPIRSQHYGNTLRQTSSSALSHS